MRWRHAETDAAVRVLSRVRAHPDPPSAGLPRGSAACLVPRDGRTVPRIRRCRQRRSWWPPGQAAAVSCAPSSGLPVTGCPAARSCAARRSSVTVIALACPAGSWPGRLALLSHIPHTAHPPARS